MALNQKTLEGYIVTEFQNEFKITDTTTLRRMAAAMSKAIDKYLDNDVQVKPGQQIQGQDTQTGAQVIGQTITPGDLL